MEVPVEGQQDIIVYVTLGICAMLLLVMIIISLFFFSRKKIIREKLKTQELEIKHKTELISYNIETQENERQRIARDLHDEVGSKLNVISMMLHRVKKQGWEDTENTAEELLELTTGVIDTTRKISHQLMPPVLEKFGLIHAIEELALSVNKSRTAVIDFRTNIELEENQFTKMQNQNLYRVCQEMVNNAIRHGQARQIRITLLEEPMTYQLKIADDGIGFKLDELEVSKGMGLMNIESRIEMLGGTVEIKSEQHQGTMFDIEIPKKHERDN